MINDPGRGCVHIPMAQLEADYSGVCLRMQPGEGFAAEGKPRQAGLLTPYVRRIAPMLALVAVQALLVMVLQLLQPLLDQRYVDNVLADPGAWLIRFYGFALRRLRCLWQQARCKPFVSATC